MNFHEDAVDYIRLQERQQRLFEEFKRENPSLFRRMLKAGALAILGALGANLLDQDPLKGAAAGAAAGIMFQQQGAQRGY